MKYIVRTYGNQAILLSELEYQNLVRSYDAGADEFRIGGQIIMRKAISYIGYSDAYVNIQKIEEDNVMMKLPEEEAKMIREKQYELACKNVEIQRKKDIARIKDRLLSRPNMRVERIAIEEPIQVNRMISEEEERGDAMYWIDDDGIKHYD
ncbi:MAG: hypothetical protein EOL91_12505 [Actinobacteria bacterium]|nr:hypothetical protein [Actinomycetota bacterium]